MKHFFTILGMALHDMVFKLSVTAFWCGVAASIVLLGCNYPLYFWSAVGIGVALLVLLHFMSKAAMRLEEKEKAERLWDEIRERELAHTPRKNS
jgi:heme exporter protein D